MVGSINLFKQNTHVLVAGHRRDKQGCKAGTLRCNRDHLKRIGKLFGAPDQFELEPALKVFLFARNISQIFLQS